MAGWPPVVRILERIARQPTAPMHEHAVIEEAQRIATGFGARVRSDSYGNLVIAPPDGRRGAAIWLVAHMDHPGLEVIGRREARLLGGVAPAYLRRGVRLRFYAGGDVVSARLRRFVASRNLLHLEGSSDIARLRRGDFGTWELEDFLVRAGRVHSRQLDDLAGCAVSLAVIERVCRDRRLNVRALLTRAEEIGFVGSLGAIRERLVPQRAWIVNVEASKAIPGVSIGGGPVIRVGDRARTFDATAENFLREARERLPAGRAVQRFLMSGGTCEATPWNLFGYRATGVAIPLGNYHNMGPRNALAPEIVAVQDLATAVDLIELAARHARVAGGRDDRSRARILRYLRRYGGRLERSRP